MDGQPDLLDVPPQLITLPYTSIKTIADWASLVLDGPECPIRVEPLPSAEVTIRCTVVGSSPSGPCGSARTPCSAWSPSPAPGPGRVPGVGRVAGTDRGAPLRRCPGPHRSRPDVGGTEPDARRSRPPLRPDRHRRGGRDLRSPDLPRQEPKPPEAIDDLIDLAEALGDPEGRSLIFVGLSSGGYHAIEAGLRLHPLAVCAINPGITGWVPDLDVGAIDPRRMAYRAMPAGLRDLSVKHSRVAVGVVAGVVSGAGEVVALRPGGRCEQAGHSRCWSS